MIKVKKLFLWLLLAFIVYAIFTNPDRAAALVGNVWGLLIDGANAILRFFNAVLKRT